MSENNVKDDGLRYAAKKPGSPFPSSYHSPLRTMSCFLCGAHKPLTELTSKKIVGKNQKVCAQKCR